MSESRGRMSWMSESRSRMSWMSALFGRKKTVPEVRGVELGVRETRVEVGRGEASRPSLGEVVRQFGLEVPYLSQQEGREADSLDEDVGDHVEEEEKSRLEARKCFYTSHLFRERVEEEQEVVLATNKMPLQKVNRGNG